MGDSRDIDGVTPRTRQTVRPASFVLDNARWLLGGMTLTFFSSAGQTFFIALFAGEIRAAHELTHGGFGLIYMLATLASAATLIALGRLLDIWPIARVATLVIVVLAAACLLMAAARSLAGLLLAIYLLRLFGQGMMSHTAMTAMGRWFVASRGRAVSIVSTGHQIGEGLLPLGLASLLLILPWREVWVGVAIALLLIALPLVHTTLSQPRVPTAADVARVEGSRQWTRREVLGDGAFWVLCAGVLAPAFIGTSVFFHQVHLAELKGWTVTLVASSFALLSLTTVVVTLLTGRLIDRFDARRVLPFFLLPLALGCLVLGATDHPATVFAFMGLLGLSYGISSALFGALWPELYGSRHLGAIRSVVFALMVFASALGPGLTGWLIDRGLGFEVQVLAMGLYCACAFVAMVLVSRRLGRRGRTPMTVQSIPSATR